MTSNKEFLRVRQALLMADAHEAAGRRAEAKAALDKLLSEFPNNRQLQVRLQELGS
jgi:hypothetical protein